MHLLSSPEEKTTIFLRKFMDKFSQKDVEVIKDFWNFIKPFLINKGTIAGNNVNLKSNSHLSNIIPFSPICFNKSPLKVVKNAFYFILKALFVLEIFTFLP